MRPQADRACPSWCAVHHGDLLGEDDLVHTSPDVVVRRFHLRLCQSRVDGAGEGPIVLIGDHELSLPEAEIFLAALGDLVARATGELTGPVSTRGVSNHP